MTLPLTDPGLSPERSVTRGIAFILVGVLCISVNDMAVKALSGGYPLHQIVFLRSVFGIGLTMVIVSRTGGLASLRTRRPVLHAVRALLIVLANLFFFTGLAALGLAEATAVFFVAPLLITLLAVPVLGDRLGAHRLGAVLAGFVGVLVMLRPGADGASGALVLPVLAALCYAAMQVLTRLLGAGSTAASMSLYMQLMFIVVGALTWAAVGDGRFAAGLENPSLLFLLRPWMWPTPEDWSVLAMVGVLATIVGYSMSEAYRSAAPATIAPFEYVALPMAIFWGWLIFGEVPGGATLAGIVLIAGAGLYVVARERRRAAAGAVAVGGVAGAVGPAPAYLLDGPGRRS